MSDMFQMAWLQPAPSESRRIGPAVAIEPVDEKQAASEGYILLDGFKMERQCHTRWCWAAVAEAVARYYDPKTGYDQNAIAKLLIPDFRPAACYTDKTIAADEELKSNREELLMSALLLIDCFDHVHPIPEGPAPLEDVQDWIKGDAQGRRAVCARIVWPDRAHFVAISGYHPGTKMLQVSDPWVPDTHPISYRDLAEHYTSRDKQLVDPNMQGRWVDTFFTRRPGPPRQ